LVHGRKGGQPQALAAPAKPPGEGGQYGAKETAKQQIGELQKGSSAAALCAV